MITAGGEINMDGPGEKHVTATGRPMNQSAKIAAMQNGNYELFDWRQSNQSLNQEIIEIILVWAFYERVQGAALLKTMVK